ncbi:hypothetical protein [Streptomyces sp. S465]|nr:hypothetical protein [Streptomyces sp. S465]WAP54139.1 hypothetical protein N6H00_03700 [Streptomyces sp. S465]
MPVTPLRQQQPLGETALTTSRERLLGARNRVRSAPRSARAAAGHE